MDIDRGDINMSRREFFSALVKGETLTREFHVPAGQGQDSLATRDETPRESIQGWLLSAYESHSSGDASLP